MGREIRCQATWQGRTGEVKALLEPDALILRGDIKHKFARPVHGEAAVDSGDLVISTEGHVLRLMMGATEAERWLAALAKPLPSLAAKLGASAEKRALVIGKVDDETLKRALHGSVTRAPDKAAMIIAVLDTPSDLNAALVVAYKHRPIPIWFVYGKGKYVTVSDSAIRDAARAKGLVDNKSCNVSERLTATRYAWPSSASYQPK
jgi:hypothetical protein